MCKLHASEESLELRQMEVDDEWWLRKTNEDRKLVEENAAKQWAKAREDEKFAALDDARKAAYKASEGATKEEEMAYIDARGTLDGFQRSEATQVLLEKALQTNATAVDYFLTHAAFRGPSSKPGV